MKKIINKNTILGLIVGIIVSGVTVYAVTYNADQINFTPTNNNWKKQDGTDITNVKDAIDELYIKLNNQINWITSDSRQANNSSYSVDDNSYYLCFKYGQWNVNDISGGNIIGGNSLIWNTDGGSIYVVLVKTTTNTISFSNSNNSILKIGRE